MKVLTDSGLTTFWNKIKSYVSGNVYNPDNEDISSYTSSGSKILRLADRTYNASNFSGKGYKILRKNIKTVNNVKKNVLEQSMINSANTIYEIRYDFDLNGSTITIPSGCTLTFEGGSLSNGTVTLNKTELNCNNNSLDVNIDGTISNANSIETKWFVLDRTGSKNVYNRFQNIAEFAHKNYLLLVIDSGTYLINSTISIDNWAQTFQGWKGAGSSSTILKTTSEKPIVTIANGSGKTVVSYISDICFTGTDNKGIGIQLQAADLIYIDRCNISGFQYGICLLNANGWTEGCIASFCHFNTGSSALLYKRGSGGTESFHGSGMLNCWIDGGSAIEIDSNCTVYNAPLDFRGFISSSVSAIVNNGNDDSSFHGSINVEGDGVIASGAKYTKFVGTICKFGNSKNGKLSQGYAWQSYGNGRNGAICMTSFPSHKKYTWSTGNVYKFLFNVQLVVFAPYVGLVVKTPLCLKNTSNAVSFVGEIETNDKSLLNQKLKFGFDGDAVTITALEDITVYISTIYEYAYDWAYIE